MRALRMPAQLKVLSIGLATLVCSAVFLNKAQAAPEGISGRGTRCEALFSLSQSEFIVLRYDSGSGRSTYSEARTLTARTAIIEAHEADRYIVLQPRNGSERKYDRRNIFYYIKPRVRRALVEDPNNPMKQSRMETVKIFAVRTVEGLFDSKWQAKPEYVGRLADGTLVSVLYFVP